MGHQWLLVKCKVYGQVSPAAEYIYSKCFWLFSLQFVICGLLMVQMCSGEVWGCPAAWPDPSHVTKLNAALHGGIIPVSSFLWSFMPERGISVPGRWDRAAERLCGWQRPVRTGRVGASCVTPMLSTWDLTNLPRHHKDTQEQVKLPLERLSFVANNFRGPKVIHYFLYSEASAFLALLHKTIPSTPWVQALWIWKLEAEKMSQEEGVIRVEMSY